MTVRLRYLIKINGQNMQWNSLSEFLAMGGYSFYVWGSFGVTFAAMAAELWLLNQRRQRIIQIVKQEVF